MICVGSVLRSCVNERFSRSPSGTISPLTTMIPGSLIPTPTKTCKYYYNKFLYSLKKKANIEWKKKCKKKSHKVSLRGNKHWRERLWFVIPHFQRATSPFPCGAEPLRGRWLLHKQASSAGHQHRPVWPHLPGQVTRDGAPT